MLSGRKKDGQSHQKTVDELRKELHEAELAASLEGTGGVIGSVTWSEGSESVLGPTITLRVEVNGVPADALVDTGSPVTIISLDFAMKVVAKERGRFSSVEEWKSAMTKLFTHPQVSLRNYGGGRLDIMAQLPVQVTQQGYQANLQALVQKGAPNDVLLGTDAHQSLGFSLLVKESDHCRVDLVSGGRVCLSEEEGFLNRAGILVAFKRRTTPVGTDFGSTVPSDSLESSGPGGH